MKFIFSGGGTGGHIYPAITLLQAVKKLCPEAQILYVGTKKGLEADIVPKENIPFKTLEIEGFRRKVSLHNLIVCQKAFKGMWKAKKIIKEFSPDVVVGTGGYVSGPILLAAALKNIPTLIQDQNAIPGITNKILSHFVTMVACGYKSSCKHFPPLKTLLTGNPIRPAVVATPREMAIKELGLNPEKQTLLIMGGSRGARSINTAAIDVLSHYAESSSVQVLHVTGCGEYERVLSQAKEKGLEAKPNIIIRPYLYEMPLALAAADVAISRAGAIGLAELTARGIPSILIPYPYAAENHQEFNARALVEAGAAQIILNNVLDGKRLIAAVEEILQNPAQKTAMAAASRRMGHPEATDEIARLIVNLGKKRESR